MTAVALIALALALLPAITFARNLRVYRPPSAPLVSRPRVSVLIPARDEEQTIRAAVRSALAAADGVHLEVLVGDDGSRDGTAAIVLEEAARDPRVRLVPGPPLPEGWCGKQHACAVLARAAESPFLIFQDADVRLERGAVARAIAFLEESGADLASGVPLEETGSFLERLLLPLVHFVLLGFLPIERMRASRDPAYAAGCGQLFVARREAYERAGGHGAIRASLHDGITLPRAFRRAGLVTDLFDATAIARCRMYTSGAAVLRGLSKNATEGLASPSVIVPATLLLVGGQVVPFALLAAAPALTTTALLAAIAAASCALLPRALGARRFRQPAATVLLHPLGVLLLVGIQWAALVRLALGRGSAWKGRTYARRRARAGAPL